MKSTKSLRRTPIGVSSSITSLMVRIEFAGPIVRVMARKSFPLTTTRFAVTRDGYQRLEQVRVEIAAGTLLVFVESKHQAGWYYIVSFDTLTSRVGCSCPAHRSPTRRDRNGMGCFCDHAETAIDFLITREQHRHAARLAEEKRLVAAAEAVEAAEALVADAGRVPVLA